jgi:hypothetical protein
MCHVYRDEFDWICNNAGLKGWIKNEIINGNAFELMVDYFYLPQSKYFKIEHKMHEILITGYDEERCFYWDYIDGVYKESTCNWDEVVPHSDKMLYGEGIVAKIIRRKNSIFIFNEKKVLEQLIDYSQGVNVYDKIALWGDHNRYKNCVHGIFCLYELINYLKRNKYQLIDRRYINVFYEHKKCMKIRMEYMSKYICGIAVEEWMDLELKWRKVLDFSVRFSIQLLRGKRNEKLYDRIIEVIEELTIKEKYLLERTICALQNYLNV